MKNQIQLAAEEYAKAFLEHKEITEFDYNLIKDAFEAGANYIIKNLKI